MIAARFVQTLSVPITTTGLKSDKIARFIEKQAVVSVDVPRDGSAIRPDDVRAVLDLEGRGIGVYNVPIQVIAPKLEIRSLSPASVTLSIERVEDRRLTVEVRYVGDVRRNMVVDHVVVTPAAVTLRAPTGDLAHVSTVRVDVPLPSAPGNYDAMVRPTAVGEAGSSLNGVAVVPNLVRVRATFSSAHAQGGH